MTQFGVEHAELPPLSPEAPLSSSQHGQITRRYPLEGVGVWPPEPQASVSILAQTFRWLIPLTILGHFAVCSHYARVRATTRCRHGTQDRRHETRDTKHDAGHRTITSLQKLRRAVGAGFGTRQIKNTCPRTNELSKASLLWGRYVGVRHPPDRVVLGVGTPECQAGVGCGRRQPPARIPHSYPPPPPPFSPACAIEVPPVRFVFHYCRVAPVSVFGCYTCYT